jgi:hypothetical protein
MGFKAVAPIMAVSPIVLADLSYAEMVGLADAGVNMKYLIIFLFVLSGCASSTGVIPMGPDSFMISKQGASGFSSNGAMKAEAYQEANEFCAKQDKKLMPVGTHEVPSGFGRLPSSEIEFMCLSPGDPQLTRVRMEPVSPGPISVR